MSLNQTGQTAGELAVRELGSKIVGNFGLIKTFERKFVTQLMD
jgi:hypothetical protein